MSLNTEQQELQAENLEQLQQEEEELANEPLVLNEEFPNENQQDLQYQEPNNEFQSPDTNGELQTQDLNEDQPQDPNELQQTDPNNQNPENTQETADPNEAPQSPSKTPPTIPERHQITLKMYIKTRNVDPENEQEINNYLEQDPPETYQGLLKQFGPSLLENTEKIRQLYEKRDKRNDIEHPEKMSNDQIRESIIVLNKTIKRFDDDIESLREDISSLKDQVVVYQQKKKEREMQAVLKKSSSSKSTSPKSPRGKSSTTTPKKKTTKK